MAGVALGDIYLRFAWQAWHLWHWDGSGGALGLGLVAGDAAALCVAGVAVAASTFVSRGRCGTWRHLPSFCLAGVALMALALRWWRAWTGIGRRSTWQAWHLETSTFVLRGSRGTLRGRRGTWRRPPSFHVAGMALGDIYLRFAWQAWHLWHTPSLTHPLSHTIFVTHHLSHIIFHTPSFTPNFVTHHL